MEFCFEPEPAPASCLRNCKAHDGVVRSGLMDVCVCVSAWLWRSSCLAGRGRPTSTNSSSGGPRSEQTSVEAEKQIHVDRKYTYSCRYAYDIDDE